MLALQGAAAGKERAEWRGHERREVHVDAGPRRSDALRRSARSERRRAGTVERAPPTAGRSLPPARASPSQAGSSAAATRVVHQDLAGRGGALEADHRARRRARDEDPAGRVAGQHEVHRAAGDADRDPQRDPADRGRDRAHASRTSGGSRPPSTRPDAPRSSPSNRTTSASPAKTSTSPPRASISAISAVSTSLTRPTTSSAPTRPWTARRSDRRVKPETSANSRLPSIASVGGRRRLGEPADREPRDVRPARRSGLGRRGARRHRFEGAHAGKCRKPDSHGGIRLDNPPAARTFRNEGSGSVQGPAGSRVDPTGGQPRRPAHSISWR